MPSEFPDDWISQSDIEALGLEKALHPEETTVQLAERMITEAAPLAARRIIDLATNPAVNDRVAFSAASYIMDRSCGRIGDAARSADGKAPWDNVLDAVLIEAEAGNEG